MKYNKPNEFFANPIDNSVGKYYKTNEIFDYFIFQYFIIKPNISLAL